MNWLLDGLSDAGYALDTPGAYLRGALSGRPGERASGEDLLSSYGVQGGPLGGLAAEMVVDPLTLLPPLYGAYRGVRALSGADDLAPMMRRLGEMTPPPRTLDTRLGELGARAGLSPTYHASPGPILGDFEMGAGRAWGEPAGALRPDIIRPYTPPDPLAGLRSDYRSTVGAPSPLADAIRGFAADESGKVYMPGEPGWDESLALWEELKGLRRPKGWDKEHAFVDAVEARGVPKDVEETLYQIRENVDQYGRPTVDFEDRLGQNMLDARDMAGEDFFADESGALDLGAIFRRVFGRGEAPLDRRLGELGDMVGPMDRLRYDYRGTTGAANPLSDAIGRFGESNDATLDMDAFARFFGGDRRAARVAAVQGPNYPGGPDKLADIMGFKTDYFRDQILQDQAAAEFVASEVPEGSRFLGSGAEGWVLRTPYDSVVRFNRVPDPVPLRRPAIPEMLQPFRAVHRGEHTVEHLPLVRPIGGMIGTDSTVPRMVEALWPESADDDVLRSLRMDRVFLRSAFEKAEERVLNSLDARGDTPWDWGPRNVGMTGEGNLVAHDPGIFNPRQGRPHGTVFTTGEPVSFLDVVGTRAASAGAPGLIRDTLERDAAAGAVGQGVSVPELDAVRPELERLSRLNEMVANRFPKGRFTRRDRPAIEELLRQFRGG